MRLVLVVVILSPLGCVPMAKPLPTTESTLNAPPPPDQRKSPASVRDGTPAIVAPNEPHSAGPGERVVAGAWRWTGTEYRWIPAHIEKDPPPYVWKRP